MDQLRRRDVQCLSSPMHVRPATVVLTQEANRVVVDTVADTLAIPWQTHWQTRCSRQSPRNGMYLGFVATSVAFPRLDVGSCAPFFIGRTLTRDMGIRTHKTKFSPVNLGAQRTSVQAPLRCDPKPQNVVMLSVHKSQKPDWELLMTLKNTLSPHEARIMDLYLT